MTNVKLNNAIQEAERFLARAKQLQRAIQTDPRPGGYASSFPVESGKTRRASLDLTRALADLRRPS